MYCLRHYIDSEHCTSHVHLLILLCKSQLYHSDQLDKPPFTHSEHRDVHAISIDGTHTHTKSALEQARVCVRTDGTCRTICMRPRIQIRIEARRFAHALTRIPSFRSAPTHKHQHQRTLAHTCVDLFANVGACLARMRACAHTATVSMRHAHVTRFVHTTIK